MGKKTENTILLCEGFCYFRKGKRETQHFYSMGKKEENLIREKYTYMNNCLNDWFEQECEYRANADELQTYGN